MAKHQLHAQIAMTNDLTLLPLNVLEASCSQILSATVFKTNLLEVRVGLSLNRNYLQLWSTSTTQLLFSEPSGRKSPFTVSYWKIQHELFSFPSKGIFCSGRDLTGGQQMWTLWQCDRLNSAQCSKNILLAVRENSQEQPCAAAVRFSCVTAGNSGGFVEFWQKKERDRQQNWPDCKTPSCKMKVCILHVLTSKVRKFYNYRFITCPIGRNDSF